MYSYSVAEIAWSIAKKHSRWHRTPVARRVMMKLDSPAYTVRSGVLSIAFGHGRGGQRICIRLRYGEYQRSFLEDAALGKRFVTITADTVVTAFSREIVPAVPVGKVAFDINEKSLVSSDGNRYDLSDIAGLQSDYGHRRSDFSQRRSGDIRVIKKVSRRSRRKERLTQRVHADANSVVERAKDESKSIVMEKLTHIRASMRKGNGSGRSVIRRINRWPFSIMQKAIEYKAAGKGVEVQYVSCPALQRNVPCAERSTANLELKRHGDAPVVSCMTTTTTQQGTYGHGMNQCVCQLPRQESGAGEVMKQSKYAERKPSSQIFNENLTGSINHSFPA